MAKKSFTLFIVLVFAVLVVSCGSKEEKVAKFMNKGISLYEEGDYTRARLEFANALQIQPNRADPYFWLGKAHMGTKNFQKAFNAYKKAVSIDENHLDARVEMARIYILANRDEDARNEIEYVLSVEQEHIGAKYALAALLLKTKELSSAGDILNTLHQDNEVKPELYLMMAYVANAKEDADKAESILREGIEKYPESLDLLKAQAELYLHMNRRKDAEAALNKLISKKPEKSSFRVALADFYWKGGEREKADKVLFNLSSMEPDRERNIISVANYYLTQNERISAERTLTDGIKALPRNYQLRETLVQFYLQQKNMEKGISVLHDYMSFFKDPEDPNVLKAKALLADVHLMNRELELAKKLAEEVLAENPQSIRANMVQGKLNLIAGQGEKAIINFRTVVGQDPEMDRAAIYLAQAHLMNDEEILAIDVLKQDITPADKDRRRALARIYVAKKEYDAAEEQLTAIVKANPDDLNAMADLGDFYVSRKKFDEARTKYEGIVEKAPDKSIGYLKLFNLEAAKGKKDTAISVLEKGYSQVPDSVPIVTALVSAHLEAGNLNEAEKVCRKTLEKYPNNAIGHNLLAQTQIKGNQPDAAEKSLKKAIELNPYWDVPYSNLVNLYLSQGKQEDAIQRFEAAVEQQPENTVGYMTLAFLYEKVNKIAEAKLNYEKALAADPSNWAAANNLAFRIAENPLDEKELDKALKLSQLADKKRPNDPIVLDTLGWVHYKRGELAFAVSVLTQAVEKAPKNSVLNYHLAVVLVDLGRKAEAREKLMSALSQEKDFAGRKEAKALLEKIDSERGENEETSKRN